MPLRREACVTVPTPLHIGHRLVVDQRPNLFQKEAQQAARRHVANRVIHVLAEVALNRFDGALAWAFGDGDGYACYKKWSCLRNEYGR